MELEIMNSIRPISTYGALKEELLKINEFDRQYEYLEWDPSDYTEENIEAFHHSFDEIRERIHAASSPEQMLMYLKDEGISLSNIHPREVRFEDLDTAIVNFEDLEALLKRI